MLDAPTTTERLHARTLLYLDRQASLDGLDHHAEKERALPTGSGCSEVRRAACSPARSPVPTAMALISWLRLAVKAAAARPPTPLGGKVGPRRKRPKGCTLFWMLFRTVWV